MSEEQTASRVIREYQEKYHKSVFVETGTAQAATLELVVSDGLFNEYHSIELDREFYRQALNKFDLTPTVVIHQGESDKVLAKLLPKLDTDCLFWLDAHWVGGENDVMGSHGETPVMAELNAIFDTTQNHVILIDDARLFGVEGNYPTLEEVEEYVTCNGYDMVVEDDIIRLTETS